MTGIVIGVARETHQASVRFAAPLIAEFEREVFVLRHRIGGVDRYGATK